MKKAVLIAAVFVLGFWCSRLLDRSVRSVSADGGGAGASTNGDVNGDGTIDLSDGVYILNWLFVGGPAPEPIECPPPGGGALPATGQKECYRIVGGQGWVAVPCEGAEIPGQDGAYQAGCPMEGRFVDHGDGTVTDGCTGLMWQHDTADVSGDGSIGDVDAVTWQDALAYCEGLSFAGHDDWRLPNVRELQSIVDYGRFDPAIDPVFGAVSGVYWSSSPDADDPGFAWVVYFSGGYVSSDVKFDRLHVRAVRGGP